MSEIYHSVPDNIEIVPTGFAQVQPTLRRPLLVEWYSELLGGLGDALLRIYNHRHSYDSLEKLSPNQKAAVVLVCHNPALPELFRWHPAFLDGRLSVFDLAFTPGVHAWESVEWRLQHGLPKESPCPMGGFVETPMAFYPSLHDSMAITEMKKKSNGRYLLLHPSSGSADRDIPPHLIKEIVELAKLVGLQIFVIGHSKYIRTWDYFGAESMIDRLSLPGTVMAIRDSLGVITSHTSATVMSWGERRPTFTLYSLWAKQTLFSRGAVGYTFGMNYPENDQMGLWEFSSQAMLKWMERVKA